MEDVHPAIHTPETTHEKGSPTSPPAVEPTKDAHPVMHMRETTDDIANMEAGGTSTFPQAVDDLQDGDPNESTAEVDHAAQDTASTSSEPTGEVPQATQDTASMEDVHSSLLAAVRDLHTQLKSSPNEITPEAVLASHSIASKMVNALIESNAAHARLASGSVSGSDSGSVSVSEASTWQSPSTRVKWSEWYKLKYDGNSFYKIARHCWLSVWYQFGTNPYRLSAWWYYLMMALLNTWIFGNLYCGYHETKKHHHDLVYFFKHVITVFPSVVTFILFLFPPLLMQF